MATIKENHDNEIEFSSSSTDNSNPIQKSNFNSNNIILLLTIVFTGYSIYLYYNEFKLIQPIFTDNIVEYDLSIFTLFSLIIVPLSTYLFWKHRKIGWKLLVIFLSYSFVDEIITLIYTIKIQDGFHFESIFSVSSPTVYIFRIIFFGLALWLISNRVVIKEYSIGKRTRHTIIGITAVVTGIITGILLFYF